MSIAEIIGFVGGTLGVVQAWPQFLRLRRLGHGHGVSLSTWVMMFVVASSWCGYGIRLGSPSQIVSNIAAGILNGLVVASLAKASRRRWLSPYILLPTIAAVFIVLVNVLPQFVVSAYLLALTVARVPQVVTSWRNRQVRRQSALSLPSVAVAVVGLLCWEVWAFMLWQPLVITTTTIALTFTLVIAAVELFGPGHRAYAREAVLAAEGA